MRRYPELTSLLKTLHVQRERPRQESPPSNMFLMNPHGLIVPLILFPAHGMAHFTMASRPAGTEFFRAGFPEGCPWTWQWLQPRQSSGSHGYPPQPAEKRGAQLPALAHFWEGTVLGHRDLPFRSRCAGRSPDEGSLKPPQKQSGEH